MKVSQWLMSKIAPTCERVRMDYRMEIAMATARAENLNRTLMLDAARIRKAIQQHNTKG